MVARSHSHVGAGSYRNQSEVMLGKPVIRGTRITVELILRRLGEGATYKELMEALPASHSAGYQAAMTYAADTLTHEGAVLAEPQE
jgi:uncharacterized protein (DUF433 family)